MRSHPTPPEPDLAADELAPADPLDADGDTASDGFVLFSLGPAQPTRSDRLRTTRGR